MFRVVDVDVHLSLLYFGKISTFMLIWIDIEIKLRMEQIENKRCNENDIFHLKLKNKYRWKRKKITEKKNKKFMQEVVEHKKKTPKSLLSSIFLEEQWEAIKVGCHIVLQPCFEIVAVVVEDIFEDRLPKCSVRMDARCANACTPSPQTFSPPNQGGGRRGVWECRGFL